jgi:citrate synthase
MLGHLRQNVKNPEDDDEVGFHLDRLLDGEAGDRSGKLYGLGHAVYTVSDPRTILIKEHARDMAVEKGRLGDFLLLDGVERLGIPRIQARKNRSMPLCANVDLYSGLVYGLLGIPQELYTPLFATARIAGWCSHRIEEVMTGGRIMRPGFRALVKKVPYLSMQERSERGQSWSPDGLQEGRVAR